MMQCEISHFGKRITRQPDMDGLEFRDRHGAVHTNRMTSGVFKGMLQECHYANFGVMNQHFAGYGHSSFTVEHEVRPALLFSVCTRGQCVKNVFAGEHRSERESVAWRAGDANLYLLNGTGGFTLGYNAPFVLDLFTIVIPWHMLERFVSDDEATFGLLGPYAASTGFDDRLLTGNRTASEAVMRAVRDIDRCRMMGNTAGTYLESRIADCLTAFLRPAAQEGEGAPLTPTMRQTMHDARSYIRTHYTDMPSLQTLARLVGTNECTLKRAFKQEFGTTVFQYLFDYRMTLAAQYLLDTTLPIADVGEKVGYDYQSHFCTAFKRRYGISPTTFRLRREWSAASGL